MRKPRPFRAGRITHLWLGFGLICSAYGLAALGQDQPTPPAAPAPEQPQPGPAKVPPPAQSDEPREAVITLKDGQRYSGILIERTPDRVIVNISGIKTSIPTHQIDTVSILPPVLERYRTMRAAIDDNDVDRLMLLVEWLRSRSQWDAALAELDHLDKIQPGNGEVKRLRLLVSSQRELALKAPIEPPTKPIKPGPQPAIGPAAAPPPTTRQAPTFPLLSPADINILKVYEVDLSDPPRLVVPRVAIDRLIQEHLGDPLIPTTPEGRDALYRLAPVKVLELMFRVQARSLYGEVTVVDPPRSLRTFRDAIHRRWLINSCATNHCHGGTEAGRLQLYNGRSNTDPTVYTNFLILDRFRMADGRPLIDYEEPAKSPLLQLGLPRENSLFPHPVVPGAESRADLWKPVFKSTEDRTYIEAVDWIKMMYRPRPEYPIQYTPPGPSTAPSKANTPPVVR